MTIDRYNIFVIVDMEPIGRIQSSETIAIGAIGSGIVARDFVQVVSRIEEHTLASCAIRGTSIK